jgi:hypothetical protein
MEIAIALLASQSDTVFASGFHAEGVDWRDIGGSFYNSRGMTLAEQRVVPSPGPPCASQPGGSGRLRDPRLA